MLDLVLPAFKYRAVLKDVELRIPTENDAAALALHAAGNITGSQNFIGKWTEQPSPTFERRYLVSRAKHLASWGRQRSWVLDLMIVIRGKPAGNIAFTPHPMRDRAISSLIWLTRDNQNQGHAKTAFTLGIETGFRFIGADLFQTELSAQNHRSVHLHDHLGFKTVDRFTDRTGVVRRMILQRDEWQSPMNARFEHGDKLTVVTGLNGL